jgi:hypothetical protein
MSSACRTTVSHYRPEQPALPTAPPGLAEQDLGDVFLVGVVEYRRAHFLAGQRDRLRAQTLGETQVSHDGVAFRCRQALQLRRFDVRDDPLRVQRGREASPRADQALGQLAGADAYQDPLARLPHVADSLVLTVSAHLLFDALRRAAQRQLPQGDEIAFAEEILDRRPRLLRHVDLALVQALDQLVGGQVYQLHFIGAVEGVSGTVSWTRMPVMPPTTSLRLSRCWTLSAVYTSIPRRAAPRRRSSAWDGGSPPRWYAPARRPV